MTNTIYTNNYRSNLTKYWRQFYPNWTIPDGHHVHHIKPKSTFSDPNDPRVHHPRNLIALHPDDHISIHYCRGDKHIANGFLSIRDRKQTEATKIKISNYHSGKSKSKEHRKKLSLVNIGKKLSLETKKKMSLAKTGVIFSDETKRKISEKQLGKLNHGFKGYYLTPWGRYESSRLASKASIQYIYLKLLFVSGV